MKKYILAGIGLMAMSGFQLAYAQEESDAEQPSASQPAEAAAEAAEEAADEAADAAKDAAQAAEDAAEAAEDAAKAAGTAVAAPLPKAEAETPPPPPAGAALRGRVVSGQNQTPLPGVEVRIQGTPMRTTTDANGAFTIPDRPTGTVEVRTALTGYEGASMQVTSEQNDIVLEMALSSLEELLVVGRATGIERRRLTNSISRVTSEVVNRVPAENITQALQGKVAGANIQTNSGAPGGGIQIRLRGISTINGLSTPLYVVDGVLVSDTAIPNGLFQVSLSSRGSANVQTQDNQVNRLADLNPYDIAEVQVLKGASAAAIYGSKASNGVVIINTKRGDEGDPRVDFIQRIGFNQLANTIGFREFESVDEAIQTFDPDPAEPDPDFVPNETIRQVIRDNFVPGRTFNHEEDYASRNGLLVETVLSLSGGEGGTDYYVGLLNRSDEGIVPGTKYEKQSAKVTLGHTFFDSMKVVGSANVIHSFTDRGISNNDNRNITPYFVFGGTPSFFSLSQRADGTYPRNPFFPNGSNPNQSAALVSNEEDVFRFIGSAQIDWSLYEDDNQQLRLFGIAGIDRFDQSNELDFPPELFFESDDGLPGAALDTETSAQNFNFSVNAIHQYTTDSQDFGFTTSAGFQFEDRDVKTVYVFADNLTAGQPDVDAGTQVNIAEVQREIEDFGFYGQEEIVLWDSLTLIGALRFEQSSVNADPDEFFIYPKAAASYIIPGMPDVFDLLKVRAAYGEAGTQPLYGQRFTPFDSSQSIDGQPGLVSRRRVGASDLRPERQREIEGGVDMSLFNGRLSVELTLYQRNITDLILQRTPAPSSGITQEVINGGELRNRGVEITLQASPLRGESGFSWDSMITFAHNRSEVLSLPDDVPPFLAGGFSIALGGFRIEPGRSASQIVGNTGVDENGNITTGQVGDGAPDFRMGFLNTFRYDTDSAGSFTLSFLLDWQQGSEVVNLTQFIYDLNDLAPDFEEGRERLAAWGGENRTEVYVQSATFLKMRELSLFYDLPPEWVDMLPLTRALRLGFTARNLFQITSYAGLDPEVSNFGNQAIARNIDVAPFPPNRTFWFSLHASF